MESMDRTRIKQCLRLLNNNENKGSRNATPYFFAIFYSTNGL